MARPSLQIMGSVCVACLCAPILAPARADTDAWEGELETVEVTALKNEVFEEPGSGFVLTRQEFVPASPQSLADILVSVPAINIRTNSRGEVLASIRGSGERQLALVWNDIPVNVPWDNRFDLSLFPALGISRLETFVGPTAMQFGANTAGGVISLRTGAETPSSAQVSAGNGGLRNAEASASLSQNGFEGTLAASHTSLDGRISPRSGALFSANRNGLITNTDRKTTNIASTGKWRFGQGSVGFSVLYSAAQFGVAPEQGRRVGQASARFWRFPDTDHLLVAGHLDVPFGGNLDLNVDIWTQDYRQEIQSFTDITYSEPESLQLDDNDTTGVKLALTRTGKENTTIVSATGQWARHEEVRVMSGAPRGEPEVFTHFLGSLAVDHRHTLSDVTSLHVGIGYDVFDPKRTAGRASAGSFDGVNASVNLNVIPSSRWQLRLGLGKKVRLPTMRELFGEALGRFVLNPDLVPETSWLFEVSGVYSWRSGSLEVTPFFVESEDTLDQMSIQIGEDTLRQRINLAGSRSYGIETKLDWRLSERLNITSNATWNRNRVKSDFVANSIRRLYLSDRPNWLARMDARYQLGTETTFGLSVVYRGAAKSEDITGEFLDLSPAMTLDLSARHLLHAVSSGSNVELFAQLENLTDTFVEPQLGLPDPGRTVIIGLRAIF